MRGDRAPHTRTLLAKWRGRAGWAGGRQKRSPIGVAMPSPPKNAPRALTQQRGRPHLDVGAGADGQQDDRHERFEVEQCGHGVESADLGASAPASNKKIKSETEPSVDPRPPTKKTQPMETHTILF